MSLAYAIQSVPMTVEEYMAIPDGPSGERYELVDGDLRLMAPASVGHGVVQANAAMILNNHLRGKGLPCSVITEAGLVPRANSRHNVRIPDLVVACGGMRGDEPFAENVVLAVEILSRSNAHATRSNVFAYTTIPSIMEILIVHLAERKVELLRRDADGGWPRDGVTLAAPERLTLESISLSLPIAQLYEGLA